MNDIYDIYYIAAIFLLVVALAFTLFSRWHHSEMHSLYKDALYQHVKASEELIEIATKLLNANK
jgi:hypothetical protein